MLNFKRKLYGWVTSNQTIYRSCYHKFGGSINVHPDVVDFISSRTAASVEYFHMAMKGEIVGAYPVTDKISLGVNAWKKYPVSYDELVIPLSEKCRVLLPEQSNRISPNQQINFTNVNFSLFRKNKICIVKDDFSPKNAKNRRNEFNRFVKAGGRCIDQKHFTDQELSNLYTSLFYARFKDRVKCYKNNDMTDIITQLRHLIFGYVLFVNDMPCAFDLIFYGESDRFIYFDVPNGGVNPEFSHLSPGSILMWKNIHAARALCNEKNKAMRFSIGALSDEWNYKLRWADAYCTGKPFF